MIPGAITLQANPVAGKETDTSTEAKSTSIRSMLFEADPGNLGVDTNPKSLLNDFDSELRFWGTNEGSNQLVIAVAPDEIIFVEIVHRDRGAELIPLSAQSLGLCYGVGGELDRICGALYDTKDLMSGTSPSFGVPDSWDPDESEVQRFEAILRRVFEKARDEEFENGMESQFSRSLSSIVVRGSDIAVEAISRVLKDRKLDIEVSVETLHLIGLIEHGPTRSSRLSILTQYLQHENIRMRDSAYVGIADIDDPSAIPGLRKALDSESSELLRQTLREVIGLLEIG